MIAESHHPARWFHLREDGRLVRQIRADAWDLVEPLLPGQHLHVRRATSKFFIAGGSRARAQRRARFTHLALGPPCGRVAARR